MTTAGRIAAAAACRSGVIHDVDYIFGVYIFKLLECVSKTGAWRIVERVTMRTPPAAWNGALLVRFDDGSVVVVEPARIVAQSDLVTEGIQEALKWWTDLNDVVYVSPENRVAAFCVCRCLSASGWAKWCSCENNDTRIEFEWSSAEATASLTVENGEIFGRVLRDDISEVYDTLFAFEGLRDFKIRV